MISLEGSPPAAKCWIPETQPKLPWPSGMFSFRSVTLREMVARCHGRNFTTINTSFCNSVVWVWIHACISILHTTYYTTTCGRWCAPTEKTGVPLCICDQLTQQHPLSSEARPTGGPYACIPPQPRCFSLGPLTVSTTLMPSHGASYERYVVCKLLSTSTLDITLSHNMSPLSSSLSHTHRKNGNRKHRDVNHVFVGLISRVKGAAE